MTLKEEKKSSVGESFKVIYGRPFANLQEADYWRNESVGRSHDELKNLMEKEKNMTEQQKGKFLGKGTALAGPTSPMLGKGIQPGVGTMQGSFATSKAASFKPIDPDLRGTTVALKPTGNTTGIPDTKKEKGRDWMHAAKPPTTEGFGVGTRMKTWTPKSQCPNCQKKAQIQKVTVAYEQGNSTTPVVAEKAVNQTKAKAAAPVAAPKKPSTANKFLGNVKNAVQAVGKSLGKAKVNTKGE